MTQVVNRVFYLNVAGVSAADIPTYIEAVREELVKPTVGYVSELRAQGKWEDLFIPVRSGDSRVEYHLLDPATSKIATHVSLLEQEEWFNTLKKETV